MSRKLTPAEQALYDRAVTWLQDNIDGDDYHEAMDEMEDGAIIATVEPAADLLAHLLDVPLSKIVKDVMDDDESGSLSTAGDDDA